ncbi:MAG: RDD family protein [Jatrophihabitans sp.]
MTDFSKPDPNQPTPGAPQGQPGYGGFAPAPPPPAVTRGAPGPNGTVFDDAAGIYLPPGVELANRGRRIGAYFLAIPLIIVTLVIGYLVWGLTLWSKGTSPALKVLKMKCYKPGTGEVATFGTMALRDIVGSAIVESIFILPLVSFIMFLATGKKQALHDVIGGTVVLYDPNNVLG